MVLASALTKRLDAAWAVGTNQGGLDTGSIANTTYHVWLIQRSDTGVVDVLFSASASAPTMPTNYDRKRRIGSIIRASGAILAFRQTGDFFKLVSVATDRNSPSAASTVLLSLTVPAGIKVRPLIRVSNVQGTAGNSAVAVGDGDSSSPMTTIAQTLLAGDLGTAMSDLFFTNTAGQIYFSLSIFSGTVSTSLLETYGWIDARGRLG
jgi:hypothetical protein